MEILKWVSDWFSSYCDEDWEYLNQIKIETVSNPGWYLVIDLKGTPMETFALRVGTVDNGPDDWYFYNFKDSKFSASGDLSKLTFLLNEFKRVVEANPCCV